MGLENEECEKLGVWKMRRVEKEGVVNEKMFDAK